jgi:hypothetical protein
VARLGACSQRIPVRDWAMEAEAAKQAAVRSTIVFMGRKCKRPAGRASSYTSVLMVRHSSAAKSALGSQNGGSGHPVLVKAIS